jgi:hypothetical protein
MQLVCCVYDAASFISLVVTVSSVKQAYQCSFILFSSKRQFFAGVSYLILHLGRSLPEATRLRFDQEKVT